LNISKIFYGTEQETHKFNQRIKIKIKRVQSKDIICNIKYGITMVIINEDLKQNDQV